MKIKNSYLESKCHLRFQNYFEGEWTSFASRKFLKKKKKALSLNCEKGKTKVHLRCNFTFNEVYIILFKS